MRARRLRVIMMLGAVSGVASMCLWSNTLQACPLCKDAFAGDPIGTALSWTTLLLIAVPTLLVASGAGGIGLAYWRAAARTASDGGAPAIDALPAWMPLPQEGE